MVLFGGSGGLSALEPDDGSVVWRDSDGRGRSIVVAGDVVFASRGSGIAAYDLHGCGLAECEPIWTHTIGEGVIVDGLAVTGGRVCVGTSVGVSCSRCRPPPDRAVPIRGSGSDRAAGTGVAREHRSR